MVVFITSFKEAKMHNRPNPQSIARWQPKGFDYPELQMLAPFREDGSPILWKQMGPDQYKDEYMKAIGSRFYDQIRPWLQQLKATEDVSLCCWCDETRTWCHGTIVGRIIESTRPDIDVVYLAGRPGVF